MKSLINMFHSFLKLRHLGRVASTEPLKPSVLTPVPGPASISLLNQYQGLSQEHKNVKVFVDYEKSAGNYLADADGNLILDLDAQEGTLAIGYNNPAFLKYIQSDHVRRTAMHRISCHTMPTSDWPELLDSVLMPLAPAGLGEVFNSCGCSVGSIENAAKSAYIWYFKNKYGHYTQDHLNSAMLNLPPGSPDFAVVSFKNSKHSNLFGLGTGSSSLPSLRSYQVSFPENPSQESESLESLSKLFKEKKDVCALILEPVTKNGNFVASHKFYSEVSKIVKENQGALIIDETFSGFGGTGRLWAHEHFDLKPDVLVYGGKSQISGYFMRHEFRPPAVYQVANTWCGDAFKLDQLKGVRSIIESQDLITRAGSTGDYLLHSLQGLSGKVSNPRGLGLHLAFDLPSKAEAWKVVKLLLQEGVLVNVTGSKSIQLSPALTFERQHADVFLDAMRKVLSN